MPPLQAATCVSDRTVHPARHHHNHLPHQPAAADDTQHHTTSTTTSISGEDDMTTDIMNHLRNMNISEKTPLVLNITSEENSDSLPDGERDGEDVVAITNMVCNMRLDLPVAEETVHDSAQGKVQDLDEKFEPQHKQANLSDSEGEDEDVAAATSVARNVSLDLPVAEKVSHDTAHFYDTSSRGVLRVEVKSRSLDKSAELSDEPKEDHDADSDSRKTESSEGDESSCSEDEEETGKRTNLVSRGPDRRTRVCSKDKQAWGIVYTKSHQHTPPQDLSLHLSSEQWRSHYGRPQHVEHEDGVISTVLLQSDVDPVSLVPKITNNLNTLLPASIIEEVLNQLESEDSWLASSSSVPVNSTETVDEGIGELSPSSPESLARPCSYANSSSSSGVDSPAMGYMSPASSSLPSSPGTPHVPAAAPRSRYVPILPKPTTAREVVLNMISQDEKDEAWLLVNDAPLEKFMRSGDPDGDTNLTVLVRSWEGHGRPLALLSATVERMKFVDKGLSKKTVKGETALRLAALHAHADPIVARYIAEVMIEHGEDVNEVDIHGDTVIHSVCRKGDSHLHVLEALLNISKFDVNLSNNYGDTPLSIACSQDAMEVAELLLARGAQFEQLPLVSAAICSADHLLHQGIANVSDGQFYQHDLATQS